MLKVTAILQTISPLHIASPESARVKVEKGIILRGAGNVPGTAACTATQTHNILLTKGQIEDGQHPSRSVPIIPSNSIRGRIRRAAAFVIKEHLLKRNEKLTLDAYHTLMSGSPNGYPDSVLPSVTE